MYLIDRYYLISLLIKLSYAYFKIREEISLNANFSIVSSRLIITKKKKYSFFFSSITVKSEGYKGKIRYANAFAVRWTKWNDAGGRSNKKHLAKNVFLFRNGARILSLSSLSAFASTVIRATMLNRFCKAAIHSDCTLPLQPRVICK